MEKRFELRKTYSKGWDTWDADLLISTLAPGFVSDDPGYPEPVTAENIADYMAGWNDRAIGLGGTGEIGSRDRVHQDRDGALISWHWWSFVGTSLEGAAVTRTTDNGVQYERMTYNSRPAGRNDPGRGTGFVVAEGDVPWQGWNSGSEDPSDPRLRYKVFFTAEDNDTRGLMQGILEYPPGARCLAHWHSPVETYYVLSGAGIAHIGDATFRMATGDAVHVPGRAVHSFENPHRETLRVLWTLNCDGHDDIDFTFVE